MQVLLAGTDNGDVLVLSQPTGQLLASAISLDPCICVYKLIIHANGSALAEVGDSHRIRAPAPEAAAYALCFEMLRAEAANNAITSKRPGSTMQR